MRTILAAAALLVAATVAARADRPATAAEQAGLASAIAAQDCSGGEVQWDDNDREFEVDGARCKDGQTYDLKFNADFSLKSKKLDD